VIAVISFTDPRETALISERENYVRSKHLELVNKLAREVRVYDVMRDLGKYESKLFGISKMKEVKEAIKLIRSSDVHGVILGLWHWTEPNLVIELAKATSLPLLLYTSDDPEWAGTTCVSAVGASLWESSLNPNMIKHYRVKGNVKKVVKWARGIEAAGKLKDSLLLLWGGTYALGMEHLMDDLSALKAIVGDFLIEDQYVLIRRAEEILAKDRERVEKFVNELTSKTEVVFDGKMLTEESLKKEVALYLAAKDRISELSKSRRVGGVSIKCQPEISEIYGVDPCLIPAFLPFPKDLEGVKEIVPTVCEGDIKGLITSTLLYYISGRPPLFGDLKYLGEGYFVLANCGASSVYYAALSEDLDSNLRKLRIAPQCQGRGGGAVTYRTPSALMTVARLIRVRRKYYMQVMVAETLTISREFEDKLKWGKTWPHTLFKLNIDGELFLNAVGSNHFSAVPGDYLEELRYACEVMGLKLVRLDEENSIKSFLDEVKRGA